MRFISSISLGLILIAATVTVPRSDTLEAQEKSGFKARLIDVPATARRLEVFFTEAMPAPAGVPLTRITRVGHQDPAYGARGSP